MRIPTALALACVIFLGILWAEKPASAEILKIRHVVIVVQENRSPDNLFHGLKAFLPNADIADSGVASDGAVIPLTSVPLHNTYDLSHSHQAFIEMYDLGFMDGANRIKCMPKVPGTCPPHPQFKYVNPADVRPYFQIAINYGFANRMFQSNQGPSFPAHQFILSGTSAPSEGSPLFAAENPEGTRGSSKDNPTGCIASPSQYVYAVDPSGNESTKLYPCFEHRTLTDLIDAKQGLSWRYYTPSVGSIWTAPDAIQHMCVPTGNPANCNGADWMGAAPKIVLNPAQILTDVSQNALPSVSWVIPNGYDSDHALYNDGSGPSWVASIVNAVGNSNYWNDTAILILWDDWGGWYDHVAPPIDPTYGYYENGFRVPLLVVSPYTPAGYVSQKTHTFGSVLKFVETVFGLPLIPPGTYVDSRSDDLTDFFDFTMSPRNFTPISASKKADHFLHDRRPVTDPDDD
jgi:phospholipase C